MIPAILQAGSVSSGTDIITIKTERVKPGLLFHALSIVARDVDSAVSGYIEIGVLDGTKEVPIDSTPGNFPANTTHTVYWPCIIAEGQRVYAKFNAPAAGDHVEVFAHGFYEEMLPLCD